MRFSMLAFIGTMALVAGTVISSAVAAEPPQRTVKVAAMRDIDVTPDEVVLSLVVNTEDETDLIAAKSENDRRTAAVLKAIKSRHIEDKNLKIDCLEIRPTYDSNNRYQLVEFVVHRKIEVTLQDFSIMEPILTDAIQAGVNGVDGILFRTTKHREYQFEARRSAVEYAKEKAGHLAELNGLVLGKAITIEEDVEGDIHTNGGGMSWGVTARNNSQLPSPSVKIFLASQKKSEPESQNAGSAKATDADSILAPGVLTISSTVVITFELQEPTH
jgi:uncharacterized protein